MCLLEGEWKLTEKFEAFSRNNRTKNKPREIERERKREKEIHKIFLICYCKISNIQYV